MANVLGVEGRAVSLPGSLYLFFFPIPVVCFVGALVTDVVYGTSAFLMWLHFSQWLIAVGIAFGIVAGIVLLVELFSRPGTSGLHAAFFYVGLVVEIVNAFVHTADGWTAVVPMGLALSAVGAVLMLAAVGTLFRLRARLVEFRRL